MAVLENLKDYNYHNYLDLTDTLSIGVHNESSFTYAKKVKFCVDTSAVCRTLDI